MQVKKVYKNWRQCMEAKHPYEEFKESILISNLFLVNPQGERDHVWISLIPEDYREESLNYYKKIKIHRKVPEMSFEYSPFVGPLEVLSTPEKIEQAYTITSIFLSNHPEIVLAQPICQMAGFLSTIFSFERDAYVLLSHIVENVFPPGFFSLEINHFSELKVLSLMTEKLRPGLVTCLKSIPVSGEPSMFPFYSTIKKVAEKCLSNLFSTTFLPSDLLRIWDNILIFGFEIAHKIALALLCKIERPLKNRIKNTTKLIGVGSSEEALTIAGAVSVENVFAKIEKVQIEKIIKKATKKPSYNALSHRELFEQALEEEKLEGNRIHILRKAKDSIETNDESFIEQIGQSIDKSAYDGLISRVMFTNMVRKNFGWPTSSALKVFLAIDIDLSDFLEVNRLKIGLILISKLSVPLKFEMANDLLGYESLHVIERLLDSRSFKLKNKQYAFEDPDCVFLINMVRELDNIQPQGIEINYEEIHTPVQGTAEASSVSDYSAEDSDMDKRLEDILKHDNEVELPPPTSLRKEFTSNEQENLKEKASIEATPVDLSEKEVFVIKSPEPDLLDKYSLRKSCSRLCSKESCLMF